MIDIQTALVLLLLASPVAALVSEQIRPITQADIDVRPQMTYQITNVEQFNSYNGSASWQKVTVTFDIFADDYGTAVAISKAISAVLNNYSGTVQDIQIGFAKHESTNDASELPDIGQQSSIVRLDTNYQVMYRVTD